MKILLTGAGGFIGSALLPLLCRQGHQVTALCRPSTALSIRQSCDAQTISCNLLCADLLEWDQAVSGQDFEVCVHLAWIATPGIYLTSPENDLFAAGTLSLAEKLYSSGLKHFIGAGTCIEYAPHQSDSCHEDITPAVPVSPYATAKHRTQIGLKKLAKRYDRGFTWGRVFYPYGAGEHPARTASSFLRTMASGLPLNLKTAASQKDFIEISDVASAFAHLVEGSPQGVINLGTGVAVSIRDLALLAARLTQTSPDLVQSADPSASDPYGFHIAHTGKLFATGWRPSVTLEQGMSRLQRSIGLPS